MPTSDECKTTSDEFYGYIAGLLSEQPFFKNLVGGLKAGNIEISLFRKLVNKKIEEEWIDAIEECILPLDNVIRRPSRYIEELDEVKPIELSRNINSRSIQHLAQHTDYISEVKGDEITPSKILNVFHEETLLTYENRFVNTLIRQLYLFVNKRYTEMIKNGAENSTQFDISAEFRDGTLVSSVRFGLTVSESAEGAAEADPLLKRVMRLNSVVTMYYNSPFAKSMNGSYVRPPIMRTNALMKNRDLRQCLELWQFIEGYEKVGYSISVEQKAEKPDRALIERLYADLALQYTVFRREIAKAADTMIEEPGVPFQPLFVAALEPVEQKKFNLTDCDYRKVTPVSYVNPPRKLSRDELKIRAAVDEALSVDALMKKHDRIEEAKRRVAEEARRRAAEKAREEARIKAEEDRRAVAEYYSSLGYRVRLKTQADGEEIVFEPKTAAESLSEALLALDETGAEGAVTGSAEERSDNGLLLDDEEIALRTARGELPSLDELFGSKYLKPGCTRAAKVSMRKDSRAKENGVSGGFVIARMVPAGAKTVKEENTRAGTENFSLPLLREIAVAGATAETPAAAGAEAPRVMPQEIPAIIEESESIVEDAEPEIPESAVEEPAEEPGIIEAPQVLKITESGVEARVEREAYAAATEADLADVLATGMSSAERKSFEQDTEGLTLEEKLAYRKMSRAKRRVLRKIAETRRRKAELRLENERRAAAAMEKQEKLKQAALDHKNYQTGRANDDSDTFKDEKRK